VVCGSSRRWKRVDLQWSRFFYRYVELVGSLLDGIVSNCL
jgi:hypothetical protein